MMIPIMDVISKLTFKLADSESVRIRIASNRKASSFIIYALLTDL